MEFNRQFIDELRTELNKSLPGESAQYRMAPSYRPRLSPQQIAELSPRISGVMLLLYERAGLLNIAFTQRKTYEGVHSGQMSFPGGKKDEEDTDLVQTALRETEEEIGLDRNRIEIIGRLSELYIPPSNFLVYPSVGFVEHVTEFVPQPTEVEKVVEVPVDFFLNRENINMHTEIKVMGGTIVRVPAYHFNGHVIWGATAIMLSEFTFILENLINPKA